MVREIISLQVGQCGIQMGNAFWESNLEEHKLDMQGIYKGGGMDRNNDGFIEELEQVDVYFRQIGNEKRTENRFIPRAIQVDLEPGTIDALKSSPIGSLFKPDNLLFGANGAGNNWAKGHYTEGAELVEEVMDRIRKEIENSDSPQGFQIMHSLGGGTGSGLGTLCLLKIRDQYPDRITTTYSVYPSPKVSDTVIEPYNALLSSHQLLENSDETFVIDNEALFNISSNLLKNVEPTYGELNSLIAQAICGITASLRFPGKLNGDLRKLGVNLVPFPRLHFFLISQAPLLSKMNSSKTRLNVREITTQAFSSNNYFCNVKPEDGKFMATSITYRGDVPTSEIDEQVKSLQEKNSESFVEWIPNNVKSGVVAIPPVNLKMSCTFVANTTAIGGLFSRIADHFHQLYKRKAFLHWYKGEGMDELEFQEAEQNIKDIIIEYQDKQDAKIPNLLEDNNDI